MLVWAGHGAIFPAAEQAAEPAVEQDASSWRGARGDVKARQAMGEECRALVASMVGGPAGREGVWEGPGHAVGQ